ncbi:hypothetical protein OAO87_01570 [bacterium]|nr:hypothetical protein [bacterium]
MYKHATARFSYCRNHDDSLVSQDITAQTRNITSLHFITSQHHITSHHITSDQCTCGSTHGCASLRRVRQSPTDRRRDVKSMTNIRPQDFSTAAITCDAAPTCTAHTRKSHHINTLTSHPITSHHITFTTSHHIIHIASHPTTAHHINVMNAWLCAASGVCPPRAYRQRCAQPSRDTQPARRVGAVTNEPTAPHNRRLLSQRATSRSHQRSFHVPEQPWRDSCTSSGPWRDSSTSRHCT